MAGVSGDEATATTGSASGVTTHDETTTTMRHRYRNCSLFTLRPLFTSNATVDLIRDDFYGNPSWRIAPRIIIVRFKIVNFSLLCLMCGAAHPPEPVNLSLDTRKGGLTKRCDAAGRALVRAYQAVARTPGTSQPAYMPCNHMDLELREENVTPLPESPALRGQPMSAGASTHSGFARTPLWRVAPEKKSLASPINRAALPAIPSIALRWAEYSSSPVRLCDVTT